MTTKYIMQSLDLKKAGVPGCDGDGNYQVALASDYDALQSQVDALRAGMDEALFALYPHQPAVARELRRKHIPPATGERGNG